MVVVDRKLCVVFLVMVADIVIQAHSSLFLGVQGRLGVGDGNQEH